jgi:hypothetical protein
MTSGEASQWLVLVAYIYEGFDFSTGGLLKGAAWPLLMDLFQLSHFLCNSTFNLN